MGVFSSAPTLPPSSYLEEIVREDIYGEIKFSDAIAININTKDCRKIVENFPLERNKFIQRFRGEADGTRSAIIGYSPDEVREIEAKLNEIGVEFKYVQAKLPLWYPINDSQRKVAEQFWPLAPFTTNLIPSPPPLSEHESFLAKAISEKCVIIVKPGKAITVAIAASDCGNCHKYSKHGMMKALGQASAENGKTKDAYLCTDYDVYCYKEPCCMCAMALVHSRIGRLFFVEPNNEFGGIKSQLRIHCCEKLNHKYRAFQLQFEEQK